MSTKNPNPCLAWFWGENPSVDRLSACAFEGPIQECAVTHVQIPSSYDGEILKIWLRNTDPKTWNLFMFPYRSDKVRMEISPSEVVKSLEDPNKIKEPLSKIVKPDLLPVPTQFEIKRSASSGILTLYVFNYGIQNEPDRSEESGFKEIIIKNEHDIEEIFSNDKIFASNVRSTVTTLWKNRDMIDKSLR